MNKLVIVGNGFDLAHGLETSYKSFINHIWSNLITNYSNPLYSSLIDLNTGYVSFFDEPCLNYREFHESAIKKIELNKGDVGKFVIEDSGFGSQTFQIIYSNPYASPRRLPIFRFKNSFFEYITVDNLENWVDIENAYYKMLIHIANGQKVNKISSIDQLNEDFKQVKELLEHYLSYEIDNKVRGNISCIQHECIVDLFEYDFKDLAKNKNHKYFLEFSPDVHEQLIEFDNQYKNFESKARQPKFYEYLFLDFNYTSNIENYVNVISRKSSAAFGSAAHIQIHGSLYDKKNKINFGFGDEMDDNYKLLENIGNNKYLENIKSFLYLHNSNYRRLLNWIEEEDFQVYILGHSCGLSDRTLLNTIFEHNNCKSIKVYYHNSGSKDNFKDLTQNISRHFNKKALMRKKLVDKSLCSELPQNVSYF